VALTYNGIPTRRAAVSVLTEDYASLVCGFPFEAIASAENRTLFMTKVLDFLEPPISSVENSDSDFIPQTVGLNQNYPNPFNPSTNISFVVPESGKVKLTVFNIAGQEVKTLMNCKVSAGRHNIEFNASELPSGLYLYRLDTVSQSVTRKMLLLK